VCHLCVKRVVTFQRMEKKFFDYTPAELVEGDDRWYIKYYQFNPDSERLKRHRPTFDLNRTKSIQERRKKAFHIIHLINEELAKGKPLPKGFPFHKASVKKTSLRNTLIGDALKFAIDNKVPTVGKGTADHYRSVCRFLLEFVEVRGLDDLSINSFMPAHAADFMSYLFSTREIVARTHNNYLKYAVGLFKVLLDHQYVFTNAFLNIKPKEEGPKLRKAIKENEVLLILDYLKENDCWLFLAALLQLTCGIRPIELTRLKVKHFSLDKKLIRVGRDVCFKSKPRTVTIPLEILPYFEQVDLTQYADEIYVFGSWKKPNVKPAPEQGMRRRFRKHLMRMKLLGIIDDISGYKWYSLKDTLITRGLKEMKLEELRQQIGHASYAQLLSYNHSEQINEAFLNYKIGL